MKQGICTVCGPTNTYHAKGLCGKHYKKRQRLGDPTLGREQTRTKETVGTLPYLLESITPTPGPLADDCWIWKKAIDAAGYSRYGQGKDIRYAHILSYELHRGPIPSGLYVCHECDVRSCVNPNHLFLGTAKDNHDDMYSKKRDFHPLMKRVPQSTKLNKVQVDEIRDYLKSHSIPQTAIKFDRSYSTISRIKRRLTYDY